MQSLRFGRGGKPRGSRGSGRSVAAVDEECRRAKLGFDEVLGDEAPLEEQP